jgi:branched-chain amino acid transport system ATP-binding protein
VRFNGTDITGLRPEKIARLGMARTFQKIRLFKSLTALDNVKVALQMHQPTRFWEVVLALPRFMAGERRLTDRGRELLSLFDLDDVRDVLAERLSYGQQRRLEITCALALSPRLLLLDEPAGGMNPTETDELMRLILRLHNQYDLTIMVIEHNMQVIMGICRWVQALNYGEIIAEGDPAAIRSNPQVIEAYLGQVTDNAETRHACMVPRPFAGDSLK